MNPSAAEVIPSAAEVIPSAAEVNPSAAEVIPSAAGALVLNQDSIKPRGLVSQFQGFDGKRFWVIKVKKYINHNTHFILPTKKGSTNACMEFVGFSTSNKVKNHWSRLYDVYVYVCFMYLLFESVSNELIIN